MLVLAADTGAAAVRSNFRIDQDALVGAVGAVAERVHSPGLRAGRRGAGLPDRGRAAPHRGAQPAAGRAGASRCRTRASCPARRSRSGPVRPAPDAVRALAGMLAAARRPVFVAGRGARGAGAELRTLAEASGALLATSAVAHGLFHQRSVGAGHLRRVRHPAGRRADHRRRPGRRLGLRAEHVDDAARRADRPGRAGGAGGPGRRRDRRQPAGRPRACSGTSEPPRPTCSPRFDGPRAGYRTEVGARRSLGAAAAGATSRSTT